MTIDYEELYNERSERLSRSFSLKEPDRVPINGSFGYFSARYGGISIQEFLSDYDKLREAVVKTSIDFNFDTAGGGGGIYALPLVIAMMRDYRGIVPGMINIPLHNVLGVNYCRFPGVEISKDTPPQFIGQEYMKPDEYDEFINDTFNYIAQKLLPRHFRNINPVNSPKAMVAWIKYGNESQIYREAMKLMSSELRSYGFPSFRGGFSYAPMDFIGDYVRDIRNVLLDIYRMPDKIIQATESVKKLLFELAQITAKIIPKGSHVFIPLHLNEYFSPKQYYEFYWPTLKEIVEYLIKLGFVPSIFYEGYQDPHLESILELPKGKTIAKFEKTDLARAKQLIGDHACIIGGPPTSLFLGESHKIDEYVKDLMSIMKDGGGFVLAPSVSIPENAKPENVMALRKAVMKYGVY
jgi:hypothetical protein